MTATGTDLRPRTFPIEYAALEDYALNSYEFYLYAIIVSHVNGQTGTASFSLQRLTILFHVGPETVIKYLRSLESKGLIQIIRIKKGRGSTLILRSLL